MESYPANNRLLLLQLKFIYNLNLYVGIRGNPAKYDRKLAETEKIGQRTRFVNFLHTICCYKCLFPLVNIKFWAVCIGEGNQICEI